MQRIQCHLEFWELPILIILKTNRIAGHEQQNTRVFGGQRFKCEWQTADAVQYGSVCICGTVNGRKVVKDGGTCWNILN